MSDDAQLSYRQVIIGRFPTGLRGLDEIFESLCLAGTAPTDELGAELVARAREHNYIPVSSEAEFGAALVREYRKFHEQRQAGQTQKAEQTTWRGIRREQVPWFPMLDESLCDGCDKCLEFCSSGVYAKRESGVVYTVQPLNCVVGCDACARLCPHKAITFPPRDMLRTMQG
jgi:NAD-dependent dihydropyrimidine dehydrogenase PreA subunit